MTNECIHDGYRASIYRYTPMSGWQRIHHPPLDTIDTIERSLDCDCDTCQPVFMSREKETRP